MEAAHEAPLKVCPHCSVATRTDADVCPSCGGSYGRGGRPRLGWSWWFAIPIVAAAFLIGYFGISQVFDDDDSDAGAISLEEGQAIPHSLSRTELEERLGEPALEQPLQGVPGTTCLFYAVSEQGDTLWRFCFEGESQKSSAPFPQ
jgi:hypothetical protein